MVFLICNALNVNELCNLDEDIARSNNVAQKFVTP